MTPKPWSPAPAGPYQAPPPLSPAQQKQYDEEAAAEAEGKRIGALYGAFRSDVKTTFDNLFADLGGVTLWDRLKDHERQRILTNVQTEYEKLPKLPVYASENLSRAARRGFITGSTEQYAAARFKYRAIWACCELAKAVAVGRGGTAATAKGVMGAAVESKFRDCAAHVASILMREQAGVEVSAGDLVRAFGLPKLTIDNMKVALAYAKNWFTSVGIKLSPTPTAMEAGLPLSRIPPGRYVVFMEGTNGHVVYAEVGKDAINIVDGQIGKSWSSIMAAQNDLGMKVLVAHLVESVEVP